MRIFYFLIIAFFLIGCTQKDTKNNKDENIYKIHENITTTIFWVGEKASQENHNIANIASAWDNMWLMNYNGVDSPHSRINFFPNDFIPKENPFYFALPYNDFDENGKRKNDISLYIPWDNFNKNKKISICKNRWIKITKNGLVAYAQWQDVGPFGENDKEYVFGTDKPKNTINNNAGLDVSPAVRDYLDLSDIDITDWQFIDEEKVPNGPWKNIITKSNINWIDWYKPDIMASWQWQLQGNINTTYKADIYDIDLFDSNINLIKTLQNNGKKVI